MSAAGAAVDAVALRLEPITLAELNAAAALQRRVDHKYVIDAATLEPLADALAASHRVLEIDGRRSFEYWTVYFDSESLGSYRSHVQGRRRRFKCRCRHYVDTGRFTFEVKLKGHRGMTVKKQLGYASADASALTAEAAAFVRGVLQEAYGQSFDEELAPTLVTSYRRTTLSSPADGERLTCDHDLRFSAPSGESFALLPSHLIVESKSLHGRGLADAALRRLGARPARMSKYVLGVSLSHDGARGNDYRRLLRRYFEWDEAARSWADVLEARTLR